MKTSPSAPSGAKVLSIPDPGKGPQWETDTLPEAPAFTPRNFLRIVGPGAILLAGAMGGGEWLMGPTAVVQYGVSVFGIVTIAIVLQVFFNLEAIRYALYTGEPIYGGIMRLSPGPKFWGLTYCFLTILNLGWSALAASCASTLFSSLFGRLPGTGDGGVMYSLMIAVILGASGLLLFGTTVERMLESVSWIMIFFIFFFLFVVNLIFVPWWRWLATFSGFFQLGGLLGDVDWTLIGALAASSGAGGIPCLTISNWVRDKGFAMGARVGAIPGAFGSKVVSLSATGKVFQVTARNLPSWKRWLKYVYVDQVLLWAIGSFVGMFLSVNLAVAVIPAGSDVTGLAAGAYQAEYMARTLWSGFWFMALLNGFWILFSTQLANTDVLVRTIADIFWMKKNWTESSRQLNVRRLYYGILLIYTVWGIIAMGLAPPLTLFKIMGNVAAPIMVIGGIHLLLVNRKFLPRPLRPAWWRQMMIVLCILFYGTLATKSLLSLF